MHGTNGLMTYIIHLVALGFKTRKLLLFFFSITHVHKFKGDTSLVLNPDRTAEERMKVKNLTLFNHFARRFLVWNTGGVCGFRMG